MEQLKPRELRIGNMYLYEGKFMEVTSIDDKGVNPMHNPDDGNDVWYEDGEGIPLTPEILTENLGIERTNNGHYQYDFCGMYCDGMDTGFMYNDLHVKYVHHAQNLFYALEREELEFKIK